jgi:hypothetical protein
MAIFVSKHKLHVYMDLKLLSVFSVILQCDRDTFDKIYSMLLYCDQIFLVKFFLTDGSYGYQIRSMGPVLWPSKDVFAKDVTAELCIIQRAARRRNKNDLTFKVISSIPLLKKLLPTDLVLQILTFI